jgi:hypothetical protein
LHRCTPPPTRFVTHGTLRFRSPISAPAPPFQSHRNSV